MRSFRLGTPWVIVVGLVMLGMLSSITGHVRLGGWLMAFGLLAGALMRAALPDRFVTDISVRSRTTDIAGYGALAVVMIVVVSSLKL